MKTKSIKLDGIFVLVLFALFAACLLLVLLTGAGTYQRLVNRDRVSYTDSTALQYIAAKVRHGDQAGAVFVDRFSPEDAIPTLYLRQMVDGEAYDIRIYCYDGQLRELFAAKDATLSPQDGNPILARDDLRFSQDGQLLTVTQLGDDGEEQTLTLYLASKGVAS